YLRLAFRKPDNETLKERMIGWRHSDAITVVEKPLRLDRARALGYRAKQGFVVSRVRVIRGGKNNPRIMKGRDGGNKSTRISQSKNYQWICEEKAQKRYPNLEVMNSYWIGQDERYYWYEVILVDVFHPQISNDRKLDWVVSNKNTKRAFRALTSSAKKSRGLRSKGLGAEKVRPSIRANGGRLR
ncbi:50S ribosomal protein L15e, partial [bacterium]|nr:50S ribosomal protein L15e [bacterium]